MADDPRPTPPGPPPRDQERQAVLDDVYRRAAALRRRRSAWLGVGCGLGALVVVVGVLVVVPDRSAQGVRTADFASAASSVTAAVASTDSVRAPEAPRSSDVTGTTFVHHPTVVPPRVEVEVAETTVPPPAPATTVSPADGVVAVSVSPASRAAGRTVTVTVHVVDHDTELSVCGVDWGVTDGPEPTCPTPTCGPDGPVDDAVAGSTDRTDRFTWTYDEPGTYRFRVLYGGGDCSPFADTHGAEQQLVVA